MQKISTYIKDPYQIFEVMKSHGITNVIPDKCYLQIQFKHIFGRKIDWRNPTTFNEKLQWLKIYDRNPLYTKMVDKYEAKRYVAGIIGEEYIIPTIGVWDRFEEIDFDPLPNQFVLKCTHDCGSLVICRDKSRLDIEAAKAKINRCLKRNYFWASREWPYKNVTPRIIAEQYMEDTPGAELTDYKLMCFNGKVRCSFTCTDRYSDDGLKVTFFDENWNQIPFERHYPKSDDEIPRPKNYEQMVRLSEKLSEKIPFVRVDFYEAAGDLYFGEMTFYPGSGFEEFTPDSSDNVFGNWIKLPEFPGGYWVNADSIAIWVHKIGTPIKHNKEMLDYKFFCFNGTPGFLYVSQGFENHATTRINFVTLDWKKADFARNDYQEFDELPGKPEHFEEMLHLARILSKDIPFCRTDFYEINGKVYFGELTFSPCGGFIPFKEADSDLRLGKLLNLKQGSFAHSK